MSSKKNEFESEVRRFRKRQDYCALLIYIYIYSRTTHLNFVIFRCFINLYTTRSVKKDKKDKEYIQKKYKNAIK